MEKYISKFITFLKRKCQNALISVVKDKNQNNIISYSYYEKLIQYFSNDEQIIFLNFDILSNLLLDSDLNTHEKTNLVFFVINKNIKLGIITTNKQFILLSDIINHQFTNIDKIDLLDLLNDPQFDIFMSSPNEFLDSETLTIRHEIEEFTSTHNYTKAFHEAYKVIDNTLNNQIPLDLKELINALKALKITEPLLDNIYYILNKKYSKKEVETTREVVEIPKEQKLSDKEYNYYYKELRKYFDFYHMKPLKPLILEDQIYCVSLMLHLNYNKQKINEFLRICNKDLFKNIKNPVILFNTLYPKLLYYADNILIKQAITNIEDCLKNMIDCPIKEYNEWEELLNTELINALDNTSKDYSYELTLAKQMKN